VIVDVLAAVDPAAEHDGPDAPVEQLHHRADALLGRDNDRLAGAPEQCSELWIGGWVRTLSVIL